MLTPINAEPMYKARIVWDITPCHMVPDMLRTLGLVPPSPETEEHEHQQSHDRLDAMVQYEPRIKVMADACADVIMHTILTDEDRAVMSAEQLTHVRHSYASVVEVCATAIMANLLADDAAGIRPINLDDVAGMGGSSTDE